MSKFTQDSYPNNEYDTARAYVRGTMNSWSDGGQLEVLESEVAVLQRAIATLIDLLHEKGSLSVDEVKSLVSSALYDFSI